MSSFGGVSGIFEGKFMNDKHTICMVDYIKSIELTSMSDSPEIVRLVTTGMVADSQTGLPKLLPGKHKVALNNEGLMELYFKIIITESRKREQTEFTLDTVYHLGQMPAGIKGFKIIARNNSDIILLD